MKKNFLILPLLIGLMFTVSLKSFAMQYLNETELVNKGHSKYFVELTLLQANRQQNLTNYTVPKENKTFLKNIFVGDFNLPTQDFGFYEIYNRDFIKN